MIYLPILAMITCIFEIHSVQESSIVDNKSGLGENAAHSSAFLLSCAQQSLCDGLRELISMQSAVAETAQADPDLGAGHVSIKCDSSRHQEPQQHRVRSRDNVGRTMQPLPPNQFVTLV